MIGYQAAFDAKVQNLTYRSYIDPVLSSRNGPDVYTILNTTSQSISNLPQSQQWTDTSMHLRKAIAYYTEISYELFKGIQDFIKLPWTPHSNSQLDMLYQSEIQGSSNVLANYTYSISKGTMTYMDGITKLHRITILWTELLGLGLNVILIILYSFAFWYSGMKCKAYLTNLLDVKWQDTSQIAKSYNVIESTFENLKFGRVKIVDDSGFDLSNKDKTLAALPLEKLNKFKSIKIIKSNIFRHGFLVFKLMLIFAPLLLLKSTLLVLDYYNSLALGNLMHLYTTIVDFYNNFEVTRVALNNRILFGDNFKMMGRTAREVHSFGLNELYNVTLADWDRMRSWYFGGFGSYFLSATGDGKYCDLILATTTITYNGSCGRGATSWMNQNLVGVTRTYFSIYEQFLSITTRKNITDPDLKMLFNDPTYKFIYSAGLNCYLVNDVYYPMLRNLEYLQTLIINIDYDSMNCSNNCGFADVLQAYPTARLIFWLTICLSILMCILFYFGILKEESVIKKVIPCAIFTLPPYFVADNPRFKLLAMATLK